MSFKTTSKQITHAVRQALGSESADLVIKNVSILNVVTGDIRSGDIAIKGNMIVGTYDNYNGHEEIDGTGLTAVPGFIDSHVHVESSLITPMQFDRCVLPHGTTTAVCDPHEMANVLGVPALRYFQKSSEHTIMDLFVNLSSCVPATPLETSGARIEALDLSKLRHHRNTIGLAEFMNIGGVLSGESPVIAKLKSFGNGHIDGHLPGISGHALNGMLSAGVCNCHESTTLEAGLEKLRKGAQVFIREGTVAKNLKTLHPLINARNSSFLGFCTDDRNPLEIVREGHVDHLVRTSIKLGADPFDVYRIASWSAAQSFGLHKNTPKWMKRGLIAPGFKADIVLLRDYKTCDIATVIKAGEVVCDERFSQLTEIAPIGYNSVRIREMHPKDFTVPFKGGSLQNVIGLLPDSLVTEHLRLPVAQRNGEHVANVANDILKMAVIERHGKNGNIAVSFVKGFGFKSGALAGSVGHDSHNITVVGTNDADMALAVNTIRASQGGYAIVRNGQVLGSIALPLAGIMSDKPFEVVGQELKALCEASHQMGSTLKEPTMMLAFLPLCVIPTLKLTDFGVVRFDPPNDRGPVLLDDQRGLRRNALPVLAA